MLFRLYTKAARKIQHSMHTEISIPTAPKKQYLSLNETLLCLLSFNLINKQRLFYLLNRRLKGQLAKSHLSVKKLLHLVTNDRV